MRVVVEKRGYNGAYDLPRTIAQEKVCLHPTSTVATCAGWLGVVATSMIFSVGNIACNVVAPAKKTATAKLWAPNLGSHIAPRATLLTPELGDNKGGLRREGQCTILVQLATKQFRARTTGHVVHAKTATSFVRPASPGYLHIS